MPVYRANLIRSKEEGNWFQWNRTPIDQRLTQFAKQILACFRLSVSKDDRKSERATSGISGERDPGEKRRGRETDFFSLPDPSRRPPAFSILHSQRAWRRLSKSSLEVKFCKGYLHCSRSSNNRRRCWPPQPEVLVVCIQKSSQSIREDEH